MALEKATAFQEEKMLFEWVKLVTQQLKRKLKS